MRLAPLPATQPVARPCLTNSLRFGRFEDEPTYLRLVPVGSEQLLSLKYLGVIDGRPNPADRLESAQYGHYEMTLVPLSPDGQTVSVNIFPRQAGGNAQSKPFSLNIRYREGQRTLLNEDLRPTMPPDGMPDELLADASQAAQMYLPHNNRHRYSQLDRFDQTIQAYRGQVDGVMPDFETFLETAIYGASYRPQLVLGTLTNYIQSHPAQQQQVIPHPKSEPPAKAWHWRDLVPAFLRWW
ncbi:MAG: hypothetical protein KC462_05870 [Cyanobacteria bacterium HKST-UBA05]|nr:hypothetical protein [Cyanobacteria bacterium HKST-UBA05]